MDPSDAMYEIRKANLERIVLDKFRGNRAAFARAAEVHPNHINLLLSANELHKRNLGEHLARKIESALGLPSRWLDTPREGMPTTAPIQIGSMPVHESMLGAIRSCNEVSSISVTQDYVSDLKSRITAVENLFLAVIDTEDMAPALHNGTTVILDSGVKAFTTDGTYVVTRSGTGGMVRRLIRNAAGELMLSMSGEQPAPLSTATLKQIRVVARVLAAVKIDRL